MHSDILKINYTIIQFQSVISKVLSSDESEHLYLLKPQKPHCNETYFTKSLTFREYSFSIKMLINLLSSNVLGSGVI